MKKIIRIYQICDQMLHRDLCKISILPLRRSTIISEVTDILCGSIRMKNN